MPEIAHCLAKAPKNQFIHLRKFAEARGFQVVTEFVDKRISGAKERRSKLDEMIRLARLGRFQLIPVASN